MSKYPIYLELGGKRAVVIGAGQVALRKTLSLMEYGARVVIVAKEIDEAFVKFSNNKQVEMIKAKYSKEYLTGAIIAIAATNNHKLNEQIYKDCQELEILCNVVDEPEFCDFFVPAVVKRGDLQIAVSTDGNCPAYAGHVKKKLEGIFTEQHGEFLNELEKLRKKIFEEIPDSDERKTLLGRLVDDESFEYFKENGAAKWQEYAQKIIWNPQI